LKVRTKLTWAFVAVWFPTAVGTAMVFRRLDRDMKAQAELRLDDVASATRSALDRRRAALRASLAPDHASAVDRILQRWMAAPPEARAAGLSLPTGLARELDILMVIDWRSGSDGAVVYSRHLPAALGFPPPDWVPRETTPSAGYSPVLVRGNPPSEVPAWVRVRPVLDAEGALALALVGGFRLDAPWIEAIADLGRAEIALSGGETSALRVGPTPRGPAARADIELPRLGPGPPAPLALVVDPGPWAETRATFGRWALATLGLSAGLAALATWLLARRLTEPLTALASAARRIARGDWDVRVGTRSRDEVGELTRGFDHMVEELVRTRSRLARAERIAAWREVARRVAHEVKNPLAPIRMAVENVRKSVRRGHPDAEAIVERSTEAVLAEVRAIDRLVSEFSNFARLPAPRRAPVAWGALLREFETLYATAFPELTLAITSNLAPERTSSIDRELVLHALENLVKNAGEAFEGRPGRIDVRVEEGTGGVTLSVEDDGPGIHRALEDAFLPYATTKRGGTGLGLAIVEHVVLVHGGDVHFEPVQPHGTRFVVFLPDDAPPAAPRGERPAEGLTPPEDEEDARTTP